MAIALIVTIAIPNLEKGGYVSLASHSLTFVTSKSAQKAADKLTAQLEPQGFTVACTVVEEVVI